MSPDDSTATALRGRRRDDGGGLYEREEAVALIEAAIAAAKDGAGQTVVVSGPPGIGKTRLLDAAVELSGGAGLRVLRAVGSEAEREFPFSGALQLLEATVGSLHEMPASLLSGSAALARPVLEGLHLSGQGGPLGSAVHGLFWLTVNLSQTGALALIVDDLHALDEPTLTYLLYLQRRLTELPTLLLGATRPPETLGRPAVSELVYAPGVSELVLPPLSQGGVAALVRSDFDAEADGSFCEACGRISGGNPFYLKEALRSLRDEGTRGTREGARRLSDVEPHAVTRSVLLRLARLGCDAQALARACAIVGPGAPVSLAAQVAELALPDALAAADALVAASIINPGQPLRFVHPLIAAALNGDIPSGERAQLHLRAAQLLLREQAPAERIAAHLLHAPPSGQEAHVDVLAEAAAHALSAGVPSSAILYLRRALEEPPASRRRRAELLTVLTRAEVRVDPAAAAACLAEARTLGLSGPEAAELQLELGRALYVQGAHGEAARALQEGAAMLDPAQPLARELMAWFASSSVFDEELRPSGLELVQQLALAPPAVLTTGERAVLAQLAVQQVMRGAPLREVRPQLDRAWEGGELLRREGVDGYSWMHVTAALQWGGDFAGAATIAEEALREAQRIGSVMAFATATYVHSSAMLWQGRLLDAQADVEAVLEVHLRDGWEMFIAALRYVQAEVLLERDDLAGAASAADSLPFERYTSSAEGALLLYVRGRIALAQGRLQAAQDALEAARSLCERLSLLIPQLVPWWNELAQARARSGDRDGARALLREVEEPLRATENQGALARLLVTRSQLEPVESAVDLLEEALAAAEASQARLEVVRARLVLGGTLRRAGKRGAATDQLRPALDMAHRAGAAALELEIREELRLAGVRPRKALSSGIDALTAGELRTTRLAASGMTNREVAEKLFVTPKTVEYHLRNVFIKLGVSSRRELAAALGEDEAARFA